MRNSIYWAYIKKLLIEEYSLEENFRKFQSYNLEYEIVNKMAHSGESKAAVHDYLEQFLGNDHNATAYSRWYKHGGEVPVASYLRNIAKSAFSMGDAVRHPMINDLPVHENLLHSKSYFMMKRIHRISIDNHEKILSGPVTLFRGIGESNSEENSYFPHSLESWTSDLDVANEFSKRSHISDVRPAIYKATVDIPNILISHHLKQHLPFIPSEDSVIGKKEYVVLGHGLKNITRIE